MACLTQGVGDLLVAGQLTHKCIVPFHILYSVEGGMALVGGNIAQHAAARYQGLASYMQRQTAAACAPLVCVLLSPQLEQRHCSACSVPAAVVAQRRAGSARPAAWAPCVVRLLVLASSAPSRSSADAWWISLNCNCTPKLSACRVIWSPRIARMRRLCWPDDAE